jgi:flagellar basal-body rod protein FlgC
VFSAETLGGAFGAALDREVSTVEVSEVVADPREPVMRYQPGHPDANAEGFVAMPNVDVVEELTNMMSASRSYEANLVVMKRAKEMTDAALQIGR